MVPLSSVLTSLAVRWLHVLSMALTLSGALFVWLALRSDTMQPVALSVASMYERLFWGTMGLLVMTGVGNLGSFAPSIPGGEWGATLSVKLLLVVVLVLGSLVRSLLVVDARRTRGGEVASTFDTDTLGVAYLVTFASLLAVLTAAEVLAHG